MRDLDHPILAGAKNTDNAQYWGASPFSKESEHVGSIWQCSMVFGSVLWCNLV
jgi:hypothetical protein